MAAFAKGSSKSYVAYKHFVTKRLNLIDHMLNKFKMEFKGLFFRLSLQKYISQLLFKYFVKVYIVMASLKGHKKTSLVTLFSFS